MTNQLIPAGSLDLLNPAEKLRLYAAAKAVVDAQSADLKKIREDVERSAIEEFVTSEGRVKQAHITLPDGTKVGTLTVRETTDGFRIADPAAFEEWVAENYPEQVEIKVVTAVNAAFQTQLLSSAVIFAEGPDGDKVPVLAESGDLVPGVEYVPAPPPSSVGLTYVPADKKGVKTETSVLNGRERVMAFLDGKPAAALLDPVSEPEVVVVDAVEPSPAAVETVGV